MICPNCSIENCLDASSRCCHNCGAEIQMVCPVCSSCHPLGTLFCTKFGQDVEAVAAHEAAVQRKEAGERSKKSYWENPGFVRERKWLNIRIMLFGYVVGYVVVMMFLRALLELSTTMHEKSPLTLVDILVLALVIAPMCDLLLGSVFAAAVATGPHSRLRFKKFGEVFGYKTDKDPDTYTEEDWIAVAEKL